jgi:hypothetical protein
LLCVQILEGKAVDGTLSRLGGCGAGAVCYLVIHVALKLYINRLLIHYSLTAITPFNLWSMYENIKLKTDRLSTSVIC